MKTIVILLLISTANYLNAQNNFRQNKYCENSSAPFDIVMVENKKVQYQIVDFSSLKLLKHKDEYSVNCILPNYSSNSNKDEIRKIAIQLRKLNSKFTEFTFFSSCEVYSIFLSSTFPTIEQNKKIQQGYIGNFKV